MRPEWMTEDEYHVIGSSDSQDDEDLFLYFMGPSI